MNAFSVAVLLFVFPITASFAEETNTLPTTITIDGVTYENVRWGTVIPPAVSILHRTGAATIPLQKLPPELQKQFGYDPKKATDYRPALATATIGSSTSATNVPRHEIIAIGGINNGVATFNVSESPFGTYDKKIIKAVQDRWYALIDRFGMYERSGLVTVHFEILNDGRMQNLKITENTAGQILALFCEKAIIESAPFDPLPQALRKLVGAEPREAAFTFRY